jgi:hypothetical protein
MITKENMIGCKPQFYGRVDNDSYVIIKDTEYDEYFIWWASSVTGYNSNDPINEKHIHASLKTPLSGIIRSTDKRYHAKRFDIFEDLEVDYVQNIMIYGKDGCLHREDGPAIHSLDNNDIDLFFLWGEKLAPLAYWEKQKNTKYAPIIFAQVFGKNE